MFSQLQRPGNLSLSAGGSLCRRVLVTTCIYLTCSVFRSIGLRFPCFCLFVLLLYPLWQQPLLSNSFSSLSADAAESASWISYWNSACCLPRLTSFFVFFFTGWVGRTHSQLTLAADFTWQSVCAPTELRLEKSVAEVTGSIKCTTRYTVQCCYFGSFRSLCYFAFAFSSVSILWLDKAFVNLQAMFSLVCSMLQFPELNFSWKLN